MGMTRQASGIYAFLDELRTAAQDYHALVALAGNPNTGKSTVFNGLTGLNQHTGNWPGKTVVLAKGFYRHQGKRLALVDLPGTYSLLAQSVEEQVARDFICFGEPDAVVVVTDATCLERNLNLALQIMEITSQVIICLNLLDEAKRKQIEIDREKLQSLLGIPVIPTVARNHDGLDELKTAINRLVFGGETPHPRRVRYDPDLETALTELSAELEPFQTRVNPRWLALRLLDSDYPLVKKIISYLNHHRRHTLKSTPQGVKL